MTAFKEEVKDYDWTEKKPQVSGFNLGDVPQFYLTPGCKKQNHIREEATPQSLASSMRAFSLRQEDEMSTPQKQPLQEKLKLNSI